MLLLRKICIYVFSLGEKEEDSSTGRLFCFAIYAFTLEAVFVFGNVDYLNN